MNQSALLPTRRRFLAGMTIGAAALAVPGLFSIPGLFAEELMLTPRQTEGPFYPDHLPLDTDNDLIIVNDGITPAVGEITHLSGRILDSKGDPIRNALVEIWQVDNNGIYLHSGSNNHAARDRTSKASAGSSPAPAANIISAPSSRRSIPAARRTFISPSR